MTMVFVMKKNKTFSSTPQMSVPSTHYLRIFLYISSSYANMLGETNFQPREFPRNGSKVKDGEKEEEEEREKD